MTQIVQQGAVNLLGLVVPDAIVQIVPPSIRPIAGVPTNVLGIVGAASWGPVGVAVPLGGNDQALANFGPVTNRLRDLSSGVAIAVMQGAQFMKGVRVTDGTDAAATGTYTSSETFETATIGGTLTVGDILHITFTPTSGPAVTFQYTTKTADTTALMAAGLLAAFQASTLPSLGLGANVSGSVLNLYFVAGSGTWTQSVTGGTPTETITLGTSTANAQKLTLTGLYTGSVGNGIQATLSPGTAANSVKLTLARPNFVAEVFDNITGTGNLLWVNLAAAVNNGASALRGPSQLCIATAGPGAGGAPASAATIAMAGGVDGAIGVTDATLLGTDTAPRKGLYALRNQGCAVVNLVDHSSSTAWTNLLAFGLAEGCFVGSSSPSGDTTTAAPTELSGVDGYGLKVLFGDWLYWWDTANQTLRLMAPHNFWCGLRANLSPQNSALNKPLYGVVGSQKTYSGGTWSEAEIQTILQARMDLIALPAPGGPYWTVRGGINVASNPGQNGENYTMMTNFLALSVATWAGSVVGQLQTPQQRRNAKATLDDFFNSLWVTGMIGNANSAFGVGAPPWQVRIDDSTTPPAMAALGYEIAAVKVQYLSVIRFFVVNLEGGQTVQIGVTQTPPAAFT